MKSQLNHFNLSFRHQHQNQNFHNPITTTATSRLLLTQDLPATCLNTCTHVKHDKQHTSTTPTSHRMKIYFCNLIMMRNLLCNELILINLFLHYNSWITITDQPHKQNTLIPTLRILIIMIRILCWVDWIKINYLVKA